MSANSDPKAPSAEPNCRPAKLPQAPRSKASPRVRSEASSLAPARKWSSSSVKKSETTSTTVTSKSISSTMLSTN